MKRDEEASVGQSISTWNNAEELPARVAPVCYDLGCVRHFLRSSPIRNIVGHPNNLVFRHGESVAPRQTVSLQNLETNASTRHLCPLLGITTDQSLHKLIIKRRPHACLARLCTLSKH